MTVVSLLFAIAGLVALSALALAIWALIGDRAKGKRCRRCRYCMEGTGLTCPECGWTAKGERDLYRSRRRWRWTAASLVMLLVAAGVALHAESMRRPNGWWSLAPDRVLVWLYMKTDSSAARNEMTSVRRVSLSHAARTNLIVAMLRKDAETFTFDGPGRVIVPETFWPTMIDNWLFMALMLRDQQSVANAALKRLLRSDSAIDHAAALRIFGSQTRLYIDANSIDFRYALLSYAEGWGPALDVAIVYEEEWFIPLSDIEPETAALIVDRTIEAGTTFDPLIAMDVVAHAKPFDLAHFERAEQAAAAHDPMAAAAQRAMLLLSIGNAGRKQLVADMRSDDPLRRYMAVIAADRDRNLHGQAAWLRKDPDPRVEGAAHWVGRADTREDTDRPPAWERRRPDDAIIASLKIRAGWGVNDSFKALGALARIGDYPDPAFVSALMTRASMRQPPDRPWWFFSDVMIARPVEISVYIEAFGSHDDPEVRWLAISSLFQHIQRPTADAAVVRDFMATLLDDPNAEIRLIAEHEVERLDSLLSDRAGP